MKARNFSPSTYAERAEFWHAIDEIVSHGHVSENDVKEVIRATFGCAKKVTTVWRAKQVQIHAILAAMEHNRMYPEIYNTDLTE